MNNDTVDIPGACDLLHADDCVVRELVKTCRIPAAKIGKRIVMLKRDVLSYLEAQIVEQTAERMGLPKRTPSAKRRGATKVSPPGQTPAA